MDGTTTSRTADPHPSGMAGLFDLGLREEITWESGREDLAGSMVDRYRLITALGEGGFGMVWKAEETGELRRTLALKLIKRGMDSSEIIGRFQAESRALALMDHPNISSIFRAGNTLDGRPFFAMELVDGEPLVSYCDRRVLTIRERVGLFIPICQAIQHAHQKAILHRDLKPSNILVTEVDGRPAPKVIDFGIAKALAVNDGETSLRTRGGEVMGTPEYMSPEQAGSMDLDTRCDIYSLGVILHELLVGRTPLRKGTLTHQELMCRLREEDPPRPSSTLAIHSPEARRVAALRKTEPAALRRTLTGDLDAILRKALEKDRTRRYETASALAADLRRYLADEPVSASSPDRAYQFYKFARRHRTGLVTTALVGASLLAGTVTSLWQAKEARKAEAAAERNRREAESSYHDARNAVESYLTSVAANPKLRSADFLNLRKDLLETALPFYEKLAARSDNKAELTIDKAAAWGSLAAIYQQLGDHAKADKASQEAIRMGEEIVRKNPDDAMLRRQLMLHQLSRSAALVESGKHDESAELLGRVIRDASPTAEKNPANDQIQFSLLTTMLSRSVSLAAAGRPKDAEPSIDEALRFGERLLLDFPSLAQFRAQYASCVNAKGSILRDTGRWQEAEMLFRQAVASQEQLASSTYGWEHRSAIASTWHNLGHLLSTMGKLKEALDALNHSVEINRSLITEFPSMPSHRLALAKSLTLFASTSGAMGNSTRATESLEEARRIFSPAFAGEPNNPEYLLNDAAIHLVRRDLHFRSGDLFKARDSLIEAMTLMCKAADLAPRQMNYRIHLCNQLRDFAEIPLDDNVTGRVASLLEHMAPHMDPRPQSHENAALVLARCLSVIGTRERTEGILNRDRCSALAVELLLKAAPLGYLRVQSIKNDGKFANLRTYPPFMQMAEPEPDQEDLSPSRFTYHYAHDDPGNRIWEHSGNSWTEIQPSGKKNLYQTSRRLRLGGISGTEVSPLPDTAVRLFIPDSIPDIPHKLLFHNGNGEWMFIGNIENME